jgi:integrase/recombinase XerD
MGGTGTIPCREYPVSQASHAGHHEPSRVGAMASRTMPRHARKPCSGCERCSRISSHSDVTVIRDYLGHASIATTGRYITTNLQMKRDALETFWEHAGIEPARVKPWKPKPDLLAFLHSL